MEGKSITLTPVLTPSNATLNELTWTANNENVTVENGVKVYTYTPGFIHSKIFVSDDNKATVGTINLDYRSLYLHFENGVYLEDVNEIKDIHNDVKEIIKESRQLTKKDVNYNIYRRLWQSILRFFAPFF